jgi:hypothetical protein
MYGNEVWAWSETWQELGKVHSRFCKKVMDMPNCAANGFAKMELSRENIRGKCIGQIVKYWFWAFCGSQGIKGPDLQHIMQY